MAKKMFKGRFSPLKPWNDWDPNMHLPELVDGDERSVP